MRCLFAVSIIIASRSEPPGWMIAVTPARAATSIPSGNGKYASDAFFPFSDGPQLAVDAGVTAIIQPGGSMRDHEVVEAADAAGISMVFTHRRHFKH